MAVSNDPIAVNPAFYHVASSIMGQEVATQLLQAMNGLTGGLSGSGGMAGSDESGQAWADAYDEAASTAVGGMSDLVNACRQLAAMLEQTGFNHSAAEDASNPAHPTSPNTTDTTNYAAIPDMRGATPPSAKGGSSDPPFGWSMIEHAVGYLWPNGDPGRLRNAGGDWSTAAEGLNGASALVPQAVSQIQSQHSPEVQDAVTVCQGMHQHLDDAAASCRDLANGCSQFADHIDQAHHDIEDEITSFLEWSAGIEAAGIIFTEIGGELWAQIPEGGRIAATATKVANIIKRLIDAAQTVAQTVRNVISKVGEIAQRLKSILGARLSSVTTKLVEKLPGQAKTAEETAEETATAGLKDAAEETAADDALYAKYVANKKAAGATPRSREVWQKKLDSLRQNKAVGDGYRDEVANDLGIVDGQGGWLFERGPTDIAGLGRRWDMTNQIDREAIEVKSGTTPVKGGLEQLAKDEKAIQEGWTITWQLKTDLDPALMARLQELAEKYPGEFNYTVAGR